MEEDKVIKRKKLFRLIGKILSYFLITVLMIVAAFLIVYVVVSKVSEKKGEYPPFSLYTIISPSMEPNINVYDVVFIKKAKPENLKVGDVITFYSTNAFFGGTPITHRIVEVLELPGNGTMYRVKGDANEIADEEKVLPENILGKVIFKIPQLGKIQSFLTSQSGWIIVILIPALCIISYDIYKIFRLLVLRKKLLEFGVNKK